jgi:hypothetical protein
MRAVKAHSKKLSETYKLGGSPAVDEYISVSSIVNPFN